MRYTGMYASLNIYIDKNEGFGKYPDVFQGTWIKV